jgi:hypothetical protein
MLDIMESNEDLVMLSIYRSSLCLLSLEDLEKVLKIFPKDSVGIIKDDIIEYKRGLSEK